MKNAEWHWPTALRALRHPNYRLFWFGQLISLIGTWMQSTAQQWLVYRLTGSPLALGTVAFLGALPVTLFSLFAGIVVDRVDKRQALIVIQSAMLVLALTLAALNYTGVVQYWHVLVLSFLLGLANTFDMPTRQAFNVEMVGKEDLMNAIALNASIFNGARLVGPAVAGLLVARIGETSAFVVNGLSFLAVIAGLALMQLPPFIPRAGRLTPMADLKEGVRFIFTTRTALALCLIALIPSVFGFPYTSLLPIMAGDVLHMDADGYGLLLSSVGLGALTAALSLASLGSFKRKGLLVTVATFAFAGGVAGFALSRVAPLSMVALVFAGWGMTSHLATTNTLLQLQIPDALRGRVMSAYLWAVVGMAPAGSLFFGTLAENFGAPTAIVIGAVVCVLGAGVMLVVFPQVRRME